MIGSRNFSFLCLLFLCALSLFACSTPRNSTPQTFLYQTDKAVQALLSIRPDYPDTRFAVVSDLHFYDKSLGIDGSAFQKYLDNDRKLLALSEEILATAAGKISKEKVRFVLVPGDLTKDGERINHEGVVKTLKNLEYSGLKVYVVPGDRKSVV